MTISTGETINMAQKKIVPNPNLARRSYRSFISKKFGAFFGDGFAAQVVAEDAVRDTLFANSDEPIDPQGTYCTAYEGLIDTTDKAKYAYTIVLIFDLAKNEIAVGLADEFRDWLPGKVIAGDILELPNTTCSGWTPEQDAIWRDIQQDQMNTR
jgi:hypothetical protein